MKDIVYHLMKDTYKISNVIIIVHQTLYWSFNTVNALVTIKNCYQHIEDARTNNHNLSKSSKKMTEDFKDDYKSISTLEKVA